MSRLHPDKYKTFKQDEQLNKRSFDDDPGCWFLQQSSKVQKTLDGMIDTRKISIKMTRTELWDACVEIVTVNGCPFSLMEEAGFKKIFESDH